MSILYKKRAPSAHVSRSGMCTNGVQYGVGCGANLYGAANQRRRAISMSAPLLRNVYLFLFVYVAQEIYQTTNKGDCCQPECDPSRCVTAGRVRVGHKLVEIKDRTNGGCYTHQYRENIFQAFHLEPPPVVEL